MKCTHVYADEHGESHFSEIDIPLTLGVPASGISPIRMSPRFEAKHAQFLISEPAAVTNAWHPAPARQFALFLAGALYVEVSDGEIRRLGPGSVVFLEDTWGKGHKNNAVDDEEIMLAFIPVPDSMSITGMAGDHPKP